VTRFPWLGLAGNRHHDYTHDQAGSREQPHTMRDIIRWYVEEFSYLLRRMKSIPEGDSALLDHTCCVYVHEHAEASPHKCNGLAMLVAGGGIKRHAHQIAQLDRRCVFRDRGRGFETPIGKAFPTAEEKLSALV
jgi:hypothetical protein